MVSSASFAILPMMTLLIPLPDDSLSIPVVWLLQDLMLLLSAWLWHWLMSTGFTLWLQSPRNRKMTPIRPLIAGPIWHGFVVAFVVCQLAVYTTPLGNMPLSAQDWRHIQLISLSLGVLTGSLAMMKPCLRWLRTMRTMYSTR
ncbi:hypothetical protein D3C71_1729360 [compost metagenome]